MLTVLYDLGRVVEDAAYSIRNKMCDLKYSIEEEIMDEGSNSTSNEIPPSEEYTLVSAKAVISMNTAHMSRSKLEEKLGGPRIRRAIMAIKEKEQNNWKECLINAIMENNKLLSHNEIEEAINKVLIENKTETAKGGEDGDIIEMIAASNPKLAEVIRQARNKEISEDEMITEMRRIGKITIDIATLLNNINDTKKENSDKVKQERQNGYSIPEAIKMAKVGEKLQLFEKISETTPAENPA